MNKLKNNELNLDFDAGLRRLGRKDVYLNILKDFANDNQGIYQKIESLIQKDDLSEARNVVHTLKGASGNLSLNKLYFISTELNDALKSLDTKTIASQLPLLKEALDAAFLEISNLKQPTREQFFDNHLSVTQKQKLLEDLKEQLKQQNADALDTFERLSSCLNQQEQQAILLEAKQALNGFDFKQTLKLIERLKVIN